jgi:hypothetical protein
MNHQKGITGNSFFVLFATSALLFWGFFHASSASAAECGITAGDIAQITAVQNDPTLSSSQEITQELTVRKKLVGETIVCAEQETQTFQANLASATVESDAQPLQEQLLSDLNSASGFYTLELTKLNSAGIAGTEAVAGEVLSWRKGTFFPLGENVNNFILWAQNQDLFSTAQARMTETQRAVSFLESASPNSDLQTALDNAQSSFNDAENENAAAKSALAQGLSPDQSLSLIKESLGSLSDAYQSFSKISTLISNILPQ